MPSNDVRIHRRQHTRVSVNLGLTLTSNSNFYVGFADNISEGGLFVATHDLLPIGTTVELEFRLPDDDEPIRLEAEIRWQRNISDPQNGVFPGFGAKFLDVDDEDCTRIEEFIGSRVPMFHPE